MLNFKELHLLYVLIFALAVMGCKDKEIEPPVATVDSTTTADYPDINSWLYDVMNDAYFWYKNLPPESSLDNSIDPHDYFEKLVYQRATVDRFSMVTDDIDALQNQFNGISKIFGISYSLSYIDNGKSNIAAFLNYVVKGSPAEAAGLKRGDILLKVNGTQLTSSNYTSLLVHRGKQPDSHHNEGGGKRRPRSFFNGHFKACLWKNDRLPGVHAICARYHRRRVEVRQRAAPGFRGF